MMISDAHGERNRNHTSGDRPGSVSDGRCRTCSWEREIKTKFGTVDMRETNRRAGEMLANLGVNIHPDTLVESLTIAQQQMVEIVKAVSFDGRIIVMDEPTSSLSNDEVEQLFGIIERLKSKTGKHYIYFPPYGRTVPGSRIGLPSSAMEPMWERKKHRRRLRTSW